MLDYETFCRIRDHLTRQQLSEAQTARALGLDVRTVAKWATVEQFHSRKGVARAGKLDAFTGQIVRWLDAHPYSAQQILSGSAFGVSTSMSMPSNCFNSKRIAPMSNSVVCGVGSTSRSRSLPGTSSWCMAEPNTRTLRTLWLSAISRMRVRCRARASEGSMV